MLIEGLSQRVGLCFNIPKSLGSDSCSKIPLAPAVRGSGVPQLDAVYFLPPSLVVLLFIVVLCAFNREYHNHHVDCLPLWANALDAVWPWFEFLLPVLGGLFLLITSFVGRATDRDFDIEMDPWHCLCWNGQWE